MLLAVACPLTAQSDFSQTKDFHKDLTKQKFNLRAKTRLPVLVRKGMPSAQTACSIPLREVVPPSSNGAIRRINPGPAESMPQVSVPAPPCKDQPSE